MNSQFLKIAILCSLAAVAGSLVGCSGGGTSAVLDSGTDPVLSAELNDVAVATDRLTQQAMSAPVVALQGDISVSSAGPERPTALERSFERRISCPGGGEMTVGGMFDGSFDRDTATLEVVGSGLRRAESCVFTRNENTLTIDGSSNWELSRRWVLGLPDGLQTRRYYGSWTASNDEGEVRSCSFDYTVSYDTATGDVTTTGDLCGSPLPRGLGWLK